MARKPCYSTNGYAGRHHDTKITTSFPRAPAPPQPPLLPLPEQYSSFVQPASRPVSRAKKPRCYEAAPGPSKPAAPGASAPITVAAPSKKRMAPEVEWTGTDSLYSVSPPPSSVPMPTASLLLAVTAARKAPTACAVEVVAGGCGVDVGATDELRRLLRL
ncbi:hypothetical protein HU200_010450 [Digitaria exilis]|uniref:Uncharacterized protein n=1 Tax=Digitaria exilis TaxID=1010633 RepID=A0A835FHS0_9POAL|nr:hypothetical protein HU200_010450 [Digitaria exilis]